MYCPYCGKYLQNDTKQCSNCGKEIEFTEITHATETNNLHKPSDTEQVTDRYITENIILGKDGKYHWYYEYKLLKNPTILFLLWKIFFWIGIGIWLFLVLLAILDGNFTRDFWNITKNFCIGIIGFEVFVAIGYFIYAMFLGFKYCVVFEMDEKGVTHTQMHKQFKKSQAMSFILVIAGLATGKPGTAGIGMLTTSRNSMSSSWNQVSSIEIFRRRGVIKVNERLFKNQVYAESKDFKFVEDFIKAHVNKKCTIHEK